nr:hypothetical protein GCM10020093_007410 [Planobispora longispora]
MIRQFERFTGAQVRVWWVDGEAVFAGPHPDSPEDVVGRPEILDEVREAVRNLGVRFVTTDLVRRADGVWRVIEAGDGQVSDWPSAADPGCWPMRCSRPRGKASAWQPGRPAGSPEHKQ